MASTGIIFTDLMGLVTTQPSHQNTGSVKSMFTNFVRVFLDEKQEKCSYEHMVANASFSK